MKKCKDCGVDKNQSDYYGIQGECKECTKKRVSCYYSKNKDKYKAYEIARNQNPERKKMRLLSQQKQRKANPIKYLARQKLLRALLKGTIEKTPCILCGSVNVEAHHEDYSKPLDVLWLCKIHHFEKHKNI